MCLYNPKDGVLIAGDVLFKGSIGRTDLQKGDYATLIRSITNKLLVLPDETIVYCGHGHTTTIGAEKHNNPYL
jgi:glyoxylase-like metal-dependent hydrolase (beta-lactamase superfamily II)